MTELPIIVEAHAWLDVGFGVIMLLVTYVLVRGTFDPLDTDDDMSKVIVGVLAALFTFGLGISLLVRDLNWQFRLEEKGIVLHALSSLQGKQLIAGIGDEPDHADH